MKALITASIATIIFVLLLGVGYPLAMTGLSQLIFPYQSNGSMVTLNGKAVGSDLIGQAFSSEKYFKSRPSAAGSGYDAALSSGSNLGPTSQALHDRIKHDVDSLRTLYPELGTGAIPTDMVTSSASGLDPHISIANARRQALVIANRRGLGLASVEQLIDRVAEGRDLGLLGEPRVNLLDKLN
jgi:K+-transporting ATPase ATPase C chain